MTKEEALKLAIEAFKDLEKHRCLHYSNIVKALEEALTQEQDEPVGQLLEDAFGRGQVMWFDKPKDESMLYTTPQQRKPLTDVLLHLFQEWKEDHLSQSNYIDAVEQIKAAHGIKE